MPSNGERYESSAIQGGHYYIYRYDESHGFSLTADLALDGRFVWARGLFVGDYFYLCENGATTICDPNSFESITTLRLS